MLFRSRLTVKDIVYSKCNVYYAAKHNTIQNEFTVEISGPRAVKMGFRWWIIVVVVINVVVFGLLAWRATMLVISLVKAGKQSNSTKAVGEPTPKQLKKMNARRKREAKKCVSQNNGNNVEIAPETTETEQSVQAERSKSSTVLIQSKIMEYKGFDDEKSDDERSEDPDIARSETNEIPDGQTPSAVSDAAQRSDGEIAELKSELAAVHDDIAEIKQMLSAIVTPAKKTPSTKQQIGEMKSEINELKTLIQKIALNNK